MALNIHYTPTYASWLNQVEIWFGIITRQAIRRGSFRNVKQLINRIELFAEAHNENCSPFAWTATADSILEKIRRLCKVISGTQHYIIILHLPGLAKRHNLRRLSSR